ncbi:MAG: Hpt domain-containing protein [Rhodospirillaceae bacterium]
MSEDGDDDAFDALMVELQAEFRATLAGHDAAIADAWAVWGETTGIDERDSAVRSLLAVAHKLSGASATFGYPEIGNGADAVETLLLTLAQAPPERPPAVLGPRVAALRTEIAVALAGNTVSVG